MTSLVRGYSSEEDEESRQKDVNYDDVNMDMSEEESSSEEKPKSSSSSSKRGESSEKGSKDKKQKKHKKQQRSSEEEEEDRRSRRREERRNDRHRRKQRKHHKQRSRSRERPREDPEPRSIMMNSKQGRKLKALGLVGGNEDPKRPQAGVSNSVELPKYYNTSAINTTRYADQIKKRKLLWSKPGASSEEPKAVENGVQRPVEKKRSEEPSGSSSSYNNWESTNFGNSQANEKFRRLMGIKAVSSPAATGKDDSSKRMFQDLDKQYEKARITTHTARGLGLGFSNGGDELLPPRK